MKPGCRMRARTARLRLSPVFAGISLLLAAPPFTAALDPSRAITQYGHAIFHGRKTGSPRTPSRPFFRRATASCGSAPRRVSFASTGSLHRVRHQASEAAFRDHDVRALCEDKEGALWIGTQGGGLVRFKSGVFTPFDRAGLPSNRVTSLFIDKLGRLWVGTDLGPYPSRQRHLRFAPRPGHLRTWCSPWQRPRAPSGSLRTAKGFSA